MEVIDQNGCIGFAAHHSGGGDNSGGGGGNVFPGTFEPKLGAGDIVEEYQNCYCQIGGFTYYKGNISNVYSDGLVCVEILVDGFSADMDLKNYSNVVELKSDQDDLSKFLLPLFILKDKRVEVDLRRMPNTGIIEAFSGDY